MCKSIQFILYFIFFFGDQIILSRILRVMAEESEKQMIDFTIAAMIFVGILTVYVVLSYLIELKRIKYLHESTIAILMGILASVFCKYALKTTISFSNEIFFAIILPPIIFSSGFSLRKGYFFQNFGLICFYGILGTFNVKIGTIMGFILLSFILIFLDRTFFNCLSLSQLLIIASVLCATDTVSASSLIKSQQYPILYSILFGQSIINDAVAIILFRAVSQIAQTKDEQFGFQIVLKMFLNFLYLFTFSMLLGVVSGLLLSYLFRKFTFFAKHPIKQTSIVILNGYLAYLLGETLELSGIITLFTQAIIIGHYAFINLSEQSKKGTGMAFQTVSYIAEAFIYAYLGASVLNVSENWIAGLMGLLVLIFLPFIRGFMVYLLPLIYKICGQKFYLTSKQLKVSWFTGLIRGVIAFALCLQADSQNKQFVISLVLVIVLFTTVGGSSFLSKFTEIIQLNQSSQTGSLKNHHDQLNEEKDFQIYHVSSMKNQQTTQQKTKVYKYFANLEKKYMRPFFGKNTQSEQNQKQIILDDSRANRLMDTNNSPNYNKLEEEQPQIKVINKLSLQQIAPNENDSARFKD